MTATFAQYLPVVKINGDEVPLSAFRVNAPADGLGLKCEVTLADPTIEVNKGDTFDLLLHFLTTGTPKARLIKDGKVRGVNRGFASARVAGLSVPDDSLTFRGSDPISDRLTLAPRIPVILYDPVFVELQENETDTNVNDNDGERIFAEARQINSLDLTQILNFAYVEGCQFDSVITNIPSYRIPRADFPLNSNYHAVASSYFAMYRPLFFEHDNVLFIIDIFGDISSGVLAGSRAVGVSKYIRFDEEDPEGQNVNAVLFSHKQATRPVGLVDEFPANVTFRQDPPEVRNVGAVGSVGWQQTSTTNFIAEFHEDEEDEEKITAEVTWKRETRTRARDENGISRDMIIETQIDRYSNSWRLKLGYDKTVQMYAKAITGSALMQQALTETNRLVWRPMPGRPGEWEKTYSETQTSGLVLIINEGEEDEEKIPLIEASRDNDVPSDGTASVENMPISSKIEVYRFTGADQIEIHIQKMDHLANKPESISTIEHVGTNAVRVKTGDSFNTKTYLLNDDAADLADGAHQAISFDAGFNTYAIGKELSLRELDFAKNPRRQFSVELARFDGGIRRCAIRRIPDRQGVERKCLITSWGVEGSQAGRAQLVIRQTIQGIVIG